MSLKNFFDKIDYNWSNCVINLDSGTDIKDNNNSNFEISPKEFLEYAILDFNQKDDRGYINALSNVKRSIECQCEVTHATFGIQYENLNFPTKVENLQKMGISPSVIFKKKNSIRVKLEHFYKRPDYEFVEDSIQIAQLFLDVTNYSLGTFWDAYQILHMAEKEPYKKDIGGRTLLIKFHNCITVMYDKEKKIFLLRHYVTGNVITEINVSKKNLNDFMMIIALTINIGKIDLNNEIGQSRLIKEFISSLN